MRSRTDRGGHPILQNVRNRHRVMAAGAILLAATVAAGFFAVNAKADEVTDTNVGRQSDTFYYNSSVPAQGELTATAYGVKYDSDGDSDNDADKHLAVASATKKQAVRRIALGSKLQRYIRGTGWVTVVSAAPVNSGNVARTIRVVTPTRPFACGFNAYRAVATGKARYFNNVLEPFQVISRTWFADGEAPGC